MPTEMAYTLSVFPRSMDGFAVFFDIFNTHESPINFKSSVDIRSIDYLNTTVFKDPDNSKTLLSKVYLKPTGRIKLIHKHSFHLKYTFKGLIKSQIMRFFIRKAPFPTTSSLCSKPSVMDKCMTCKHICHFSNIRSRVTGRTYGVIGNTDCSSKNVLYV